MSSEFFIAVLGNALFALIVAATGYFLFRSAKDGYWGKNSEDVKYQLFDDRGADIHVCSAPIRRGVPSSATERNHYDRKPLHT